MSLDNWDGTARAVLFGFADGAVRTMALAALAAATLAILRVKQPAARLRVWTFVLCGGLLLPLADWLLPDLTLPLPLFVLTPASLPPEVWIASALASRTRRPPRPRCRSAALLLAVYVFGVAGSRYVARAAGSPRFASSGTVGRSPIRVALERTGRPGVGTRSRSRRAAARVRRRSTCR